MESVTGYEGLNEHDLQAALTPIWTREGLDIGGRHCFLLAWEMMFPSWRVNDHRKEFNLPSIDFVFVDAAGAMYAVEVKRVVQSPANAWNVLAQVSHRATLMHASRTFEKLQAAFVLSRTHPDRNPPGASKEGLDLLEHHRAFFGLERSLPRAAFLAGPVRRTVAARRFGPTWQEALERFTCESEEQILAHCDATYRLASKGNIEMKRLTTLGSWQHVVTPTIGVVGIP